MVEPLRTGPGISPDGLQLYFNEGDRSERAYRSGTFGNGPSVFVKTRNSRDEEFGPAIELGDPPNTSSTFFAVWGPEPSSDGTTLYFSSDRAGTPNEYGVWQTTLAEPCDINADGSCDVDDLTPSSLFRVNLVEGSERESDILNYDISGDGRVDGNDLDTWLAEAAASNGLEAAYLRGDANLDGQVNADDLNALALNWLSADATSWSQGDFNGDGNVNSSDLNDLALSWRRGVVAAASAHAVPEPSSIVLLLLGGVALVRRSG